MARLISFDIDGTLEVGDPPGTVPVASVLRAHELGFIVGSCSDRPLSVQRMLWERHSLPMQFTVLKQHLRSVREQFDEVEHYLHIGDTDVDRLMAEAAGFDFVHSVDEDVNAFLRSILGAH